MTRPFLAFDTSTDHLALAVGDLDRPGAVLAADDFSARRAANTIVLAAAHRLLASVDLEPRDLAAVAVGRGPGSFTGVRIGVATAKGIAHALGVPLAGFGTLDAIARRWEGPGLLGVVGDAMRGEVYPALFEVRPGHWERLSEESVAFPETVAGQWAALDRPVSMIGAGLARHREAFVTALGDRASFLSESLWTPNGDALVAAAWAASGESSLTSVAGATLAEGYELAHPQRLLPVYTRLSDAEEAERLKLGHAHGVPEGGVAGPGDDVAEHGEGTTS